MRLFLYGARRAEIAGLLDNAEFTDLIRPLFRAPEAVVPDPPPACWEVAVEQGLFVPEGRSYRAGPRLVVVPAAAEGALPALMGDALARYLEVAATTIDLLRQAYESTSTYERFPWSEVSHTVAGGFFLDLAMGREVVLSGRIERRQNDTVVWVFEQVSAQNGLGVQLFGASRAYRIFLGQLWHARVTRPPLRLDHPHIALLARLAAGEPEAGRGSKELLYLRYLKLVGQDGRVRVPVFDAADAARMLAPLAEGARRLVAEGVGPALDQLPRHPWWQERAASEPYRHAAVRMVLEYGADRAVAAGLLEPFPTDSEPPLAWGRWLWFEPEGPLQLLVSAGEDAGGEA